MSKLLFTREGDTARRLLFTRRNGEQVMLEGSDAFVANAWAKLEAEEQAKSLATNRRTRSSQPVTPMPVPTLNFGSEEADDEVVHEVVHAGGGSLPSADMVTPLPLPTMNFEKKGDSSRGRGKVVPNPIPSPYIARHGVTRGVTPLPLPKLEF